MTMPDPDMLFIRLADFFAARRTEATPGDPPAQDAEADPAERS